MGHGSAFDDWAEHRKQAPPRETNPLRWARRRWNEFAVLWEADGIVARAENASYINNLPTWALIAAVALGAPLVAPGDWRAAAEEHLDTPNKLQHEKAVIRGLTPSLETPHERLENQWAFSSREALQWEIAQEIKDLRARAAAYIPPTQQL